MIVYNSRISTILLSLPTLERIHVALASPFNHTHTQVLVIFQNCELLRLN